MVVLFGFCHKHMKEKTELESKDLVIDLLESSTLKVRQSPFLGAIIELLAILTG